MQNGEQSSATPSPAAVVIGLVADNGDEPNGIARVSALAKNVVDEAENAT
jgi:hypothetical protein